MLSRLEKVITNIFNGSPKHPLLTPPHSDLISLLPDDMLINILLSLRARDVYHISRTNRRFFQLIKNNRLWEGQYKKYFPKSYQDALYDYQDYVTRAKTKQEISILNAFWPIRFKSDYLRFKINFKQDMAKHVAMNPDIWKFILSIREGDLETFKKILKSRGRALIDTCYATNSSLTSKSHIQQYGSQAMMDFAYQLNTRAFDNHNTHFINAIGYNQSLESFQKYPLSVIPLVMFELHRPEQLKKIILSDTIIPAEILTIVSGADCFRVLLISQNCHPDVINAALLNAVKENDSELLQQSLHRGAANIIDAMKLAITLKKQNCLHELLTHLNTTKNMDNKSLSVLLAHTMRCNNFPAFYSCLSNLSTRLTDFDRVLVGEAISSSLEVSRLDILKALLSFDASLFNKRHFYKLNYLAVKTNDQPLINRINQLTAFPFKKPGTLTAPDQPLPTTIKFEGCLFATKKGFTQKHQVKKRSGEMIPEMAFRRMR